jgi:aspartokinase/homoserine dehydrogenase 1
MRVLKFGGTSVANAQNIKLVLDIVVNKAKEEKLIVVVSAFSKVTDLLQLASIKAGCQ